MDKPIVLWIQWIDAKTWCNDWLDHNDIAPFVLPTCESYGFVIKEDKDAIFLSQTLSEDENRNIIGIPKSCILKQKKIK